MVEVKNLTKFYGSIKAVDDISFTVETGEVLGFLGPNGAGKSTTMNMITGYIAPTEGEVLIDGIDIMDEPELAKKNIGYLPEIPPLYPDLKVREYLSFVAELKKVSKKDRDIEVHKIMSKTKTLDVSERLIKHLSKGYKQRVGLAGAMMGNPDILILDEPTVGLDPKQIIEIRKLIRNLGKKHTVIFSSHVLSEVSEVCDRIVVISKGKIVADAKTDELSAQVSGGQKLSLTAEGSTADITEAIKRIPAVKRVTRTGSNADGSGKYMIEYETSSDIRRDVYNAMVRVGAVILDMQSGNETLEDMFLKLTSGKYDSRKEDM